MSGNKPAYRVVAVEAESYEREDGSTGRRMKKVDGKGIYTDIAAFWPMEDKGTQVPGVFQGRMKPFGKIVDICIVVTDDEGRKTTISEDTHFFNLRAADAGSSRGGRRQQTADDGEFE